MDRREIVMNSVPKVQIHVSYWASDKYHIHGSLSGYLISFRKKIFRFAPTRKVVMNLGPNVPCHASYWLQILLAVLIWCNQIYSAIQHLCGLDADFCAGLVLS